MTAPMNLSFFETVIRIFGLSKKWFLNHAEYWVSDLVGLPMAMRRFLGGSTTSSSATNDLHNFYGRNFWSLPFGPLRGLLTILIWPFALIIAVIVFTLWNGKAIKQRGGVTIREQIAGQIKMAVQHSIAPFWFYMFELYDKNRSVLAPLYLMAHETIGPAFTLLQPKVGTDLLADKVWFAKHCIEKNVRAVPVYLYLSAGTILPALSQNTTLPDEDLFIKPRQGNGGHNAERWDYVGDDNYQNSAGQKLSKTQLMTVLLEQSLKDDFIIQPRLINHPSLADISNDALSTVRVLTCRNEQGEPEATNVAFRMAVGGNSVVDNFHQGGLAAPVNIKTGAIGLASDIGIKPGMGWREVHPVSGVRFKDRILPDWQAVLNLACDAHKAFPARTMVGWDVAMLKDGPMIIEGNGKPDLDIHQRVERRPLGDQRIAELVVFNLHKELNKKGH
jgi:Sugar-transfer associated ATP-grasp